MSWPALPAQLRLRPPPQISATKPARATCPLETSPDTIAMGVITARRPADAEFVVRNQQSIPLTLARVVTSCPCIGVSGAPVGLGPNEEKRLKVAFDPADDPDFRGALSVEISGYDEGGGTLFRARAELEVR
ncbi:MAG: DUF1573 domain-containing protein [Isosphaeraceae bacterium]